MPRPLSKAPNTTSDARDRKGGPPRPPMGARSKKTKETDVIKGSSPVFITENEFRARVAVRAYELYAQRQAMTVADDWLQAERLVKEHMLAQGRHSGSV